MTLRHMDSDRAGLKANGQAADPTQGWTNLSASVIVQTEKLSASSRTPPADSASTEAVSKILAGRPHWHLAAPGSDGNACDQNNS
ncbi:MAG TPA: hypothetical protein V6D10_22020 [Trichocoleus sp.]